MREHTNPIDTIRSHLDEPELLTQLAEEATELAHAALKLRRAYTGTNPTPVSSMDAYGKLLEEVADLEVCLAVLDYVGDYDTEFVRKISVEKINRWAERLTAAKDTNVPGNIKQHRMRSNLPDKDLVAEVRSSAFAHEFADRNIIIELCRRYENRLERR